MSQGHLTEVTLHHEHKAYRAHFHGLVPTEDQSELMPLMKELAQIHPVHLRGNQATSRRRLHPFLLAQI